MLLSFLIAATGCFFAALCYAEFAAMIPQAGSAYTYTYATMGRSMAWFIGWNMVLEFGVSASTVAAGWSGYFLSLLHGFGIDYPAAWANAPFAGTGISDLHLTGAMINLPAFLIMLVITAILVVGISESARFNAAMVVVKVGDRGRGDPVRPAAMCTWPICIPSFRPTPGVWGHFGPSGVLAASGTMFFAYVGFETVSVAAQETRNPERDISDRHPGRAGDLHLALCADVRGADRDHRLAPAGCGRSGVLCAGTQSRPDTGWCSRSISRAIAGLISVAFGSLYGQSRVFYAMARDGFLPPAFAKVHPRFRTPHLCTIITGVVGALIAAVFPLDLLADLVSIGTLLAFISVCAGIMILRKTAPKTRRKFRTPWVWFVAPAGIATCGVMMFSLSNGTWMRLVVWTAIGFLIYFGYGIRHAAPWKWSVTDES